MNTPEKRNVWLVPAVLISLSSICFSAGVYVGRYENAIQVTTIREMIKAHEAQDTHTGAMPRSLVELHLTNIINRLDRIEAELKERK